MNSPRYFVTGTDTGIGKTVVSTVLTSGFKSHYWKPVQTGSLEGRDTEFVARWAGRDHVYPEGYVFAEPVSPHRAAELENRAIEMSQLLHQFQTLRGPLVVEGAGGVLVPLNAKELMIDLIQALALPTVVVTSLKLGTINHTLLTFEALRRRQIALAGFVTVGEDNPATLRSLENYGEALHIGHVDRATEFSSRWFDRAFSRLCFTQIHSRGLSC